MATCIPDGWWIAPSRWDKNRRNLDRPLLFHYYRRGKSACNGSRWIGPFISITMGNTDGLRCQRCEQRMVLPLPLSIRRKAERDALVQGGTP